MIHRLTPPLIAAMALAASCPTDPPEEPETCVRPAAPADRERFMVVSHPYGEGGAAADRWEVLRVGQGGALSRIGEEFQIGRAYGGEVVFTPDGAVGIAVLEDGSLGVFSLGADGSANVIQAGFEGSFYAGQVVMDPAGDRAWVLDPNWRENGGGIYEIGIACTGEVFDRGMVAPSKLAYAMALMPEGDVGFLAARDILDSPPGDDGHLVELGGAPALLGGADVFGDDEAIVASAAVSPDGRWGFIGDNNLFSGTGDRVGVMDLDSLSPVPGMEVEDPVSIDISPWGDQGIVVSGFGDAIFRFNISGGLVPAQLVGEVSYTGGRPQLPEATAQITRGSLSGTVFVAENVGVRTLRFLQGGGVADDGALRFGAGYTSIVGALGVQP